jgi:single-stranded-DNA-specific exonuclease
MGKLWEISRPDENTVKNLCTTLGINPVLATLLANRDFTVPDKANQFLNAGLKDLQSPFEIKDMDRATHRIHQAIAKREKILIFGDYDVDGVTAITLLYEFLKRLDADVSYYIPHRTQEGYGLKARQVSEYAAPNHIGLIITADCGITSHGAADIAANLGIDLIITDHHNPSETLPGAYAVVNPKRTDCTAGFENLAGVGVVFCLVVCLRKYLREQGMWENATEPNLKHACDLVALGTIADMVPLDGGNRILSKAGLAVMNSGSRSGLRMLADGAGINPGRVSATDVGFRLGPRINAAGRLDHAGQVVELLLTDDIPMAAKIVDRLNRLNEKRQALERHILDGITEHLENEPALLECKAIVLAGEDWHLGVLGIVASRLLRTYYRPVILLAVENGVGKGSARSIPGFDLYQGLNACAGELEKFGGHTLAAGLEIKARNIDRFRDCFEAAVEQTTTPEDFIPRVEIDAVLGFDAISGGLIDELNKMKPYGQGNPEPLFMAENVRVVSSRIVGGHHRKMELEQPHIAAGRRFQAIEFQTDITAPAPQRFERLAFRLDWNYFNHKKTAQITVVET